MKIIQYLLHTGAQDAGLYTVSIPYSENNLQIAKAEAYNGEYTIEDDETADVAIAQEDTDAMLIDHEYRLTLLELGLTESEV